MGHPDKVADQVSDAVLDFCLQHDPASRVACETTPALMPLPIQLAHRLVEYHAELRKAGKLRWLRPDAKSQVTVEYNADGTPHRIHTVVLSTQHDESVMTSKGGKDYFTDDARGQVIEQ